MVVSGAPEKTRYHALHICDMALDMVDAMSNLIDPSTNSNMKIRVGKYVKYSFYIYSTSNFRLRNKFLELIHCRCVCLLHVYRLTSTLCQLNVLICSAGC